MMKKTQILQDYMKQLKLGGIHENFEKLVQQAQQKQISYLDFALEVFKTEIDIRNEKDLLKRLKTAKMPLKHKLDEYDYHANNGVSKQQLLQLRECTWMEQNYNVILLGPSGTGKTFLAAGLCYDALKNGYKALFRSMEQINQVLKMKDITKTALTEYNRICKADLLVIDDIMMFPIEKKQSVGLFNLVNMLHEKASFIITTNKSPEEWAKMLDDEVLATAILDRLLFRCEIVRLSGKSYRLKNRKTIFNKN